MVNNIIHLVAAFIVAVVIYFITEPNTLSGGWGPFIITLPAIFLIWYNEASGRTRAIGWFILVLFLLLNLMLLILQRY